MGTSLGAFGRKTVYRKPNSEVKEGFPALHYWAHPKNGSMLPMRASFMGLACKAFERILDLCRKMRRRWRLLTFAYKQT